ncbi:MAG TPA: SDR family oxidoreductase [Bryobacteraceae bacterium]|nr:SDR family oxidoreductase [Bryobacteraceae bacterium]
METLTGKIAAVTGGTRGIGRAIAESLLRQGVSVAICGRSAESVGNAVSSLRSAGNVFGCPADVTRLEDVRKFFQAIDHNFGGLDILVNNAGLAVFKKVADMTAEEWHRNIDLNLNAVFYCSREALARFKNRGGGFIVNISSLAGKNAFAGGAAYNASKFGLNGFSEAMMLDHRHDNVRVSYIMPGSVATQFSGGPAGRTGDASWMIAPEDVAEAVSLVLRMPARSMISRIEMRPSRPQK